MGPYEACGYVAVWEMGIGGELPHNRFTSYESGKVRWQPHAAAILIVKNFPEVTAVHRPYHEHHLHLIYYRYFTIDALRHLQNH